MTSFQPREPYSSEELAKLYPKDLELQLVQILLRHGERTPVNPRFQNTGLGPYWPYCNAAQRFTSAIMTSPSLDQWGELKFRRRLEAFGMDDGPVIATGPDGEFDGVCNPGELTDKGRETTLALGQRLRHLDMIYLRSTPIPRALESVQQAFWGLYPSTARTADFPPPTIITRSPADETLYPNDGNCRRFAHLSRAFAQRAAERWNDTEDMAYLSKLFSKYMPGEAKVAVNSHPRLSGIMDTINSTDAHGPQTRLPNIFYDQKAREIIDRITVEEWYAGYTESVEYRMLGIGGLMADLTSRMIGSIERNGSTGVLEVGGENGHLGQGRGGEKDIRLALSGCHDTTLAGALSSLGAFDGEKWPPFTSHIAFELFRKRNVATPPPAVPGEALSRTSKRSRNWWNSFFESNESSQPTSANPPTGIARKPMEELTKEQKQSLEGYYVRIRYNDKVMQVPGCKTEGKHLEGDPTFCTFEAFKSIVDKYTPRNWKHACASNINAPSFPETVEPAGY